jgi:hypothetical protein
MEFLIEIYPFAHALFPAAMVRETDLKVRDFVG